MFGQVTACRTEVMWLCSCLAHKPSLFKVLPLAGSFLRRGPACSDETSTASRREGKASGKIVRVPSPSGGLLEERFLGPKL